MSKPIKVGIIGTGIFAYRHLRAYAAVGSDKFQIVACCNRSKEKAEKFAKEAGIPAERIYQDPKDLIADPNVELVDTILPIQFNKEIVEAAISAGKHIIIEKPIAANLDDARDIVKAGQDAKTVVALAENWSYHPKVRAVGEFIQNGGIGDIINFTYNSARPYNVNSPYHTTTWRQNPEHPGGYLSDGIVHDMAHLIPILGKFDSVCAFTTKTYKIHVVEDTLATSIRLCNGGIGVANFTFCSAGVKQFRLEVYGTKGTIRVVNDNQVELLDVNGNSVDTQQFERPDSLEDVEGEMANLYQAIRHGEQLGITLEEGYHSLSFIVAALKSVQTESSTKIQ